MSKKTNTDREKTDGDKQDGEIKPKSNLPLIYGIITFAFLILISLLMRMAA